MLHIPLDNLKITKSTGDILLGTVIARDRVGEKTPSYIYDGELVGSFNGVKTFLNYLKTEMPKPKNSHYNSSISKGSKSDFQSFTSYDVALNTYINKSETLVDFTEIEEVLQSFDEIGKDVEYDITGDFIDIARYMEGIPEVFGSLHNGLVRKYRANITLNLSWIWSAKAETINYRLKKMLSLVDWLEINNIRCSITAISSQECSHLEINVKDYDETLDLRELAVVSHGDFLRRMVFRFDEWSDTISSGYGSAYAYSDHMKGQEDKEAFEEFNIFIDSRIDDEKLYDEKFEQLRQSIIKDIEEGKMTDKKVLHEY